MSNNTKLGFHDRAEAGRQLAEKLEHYKRHAVVLALPRGGVPVGFEIAKALQVPLDILPVRKLGAPNHEELAMGAIAYGGHSIFNHDIIRELQTSQQAMSQVIAREKEELERRNREYRDGKSFPDVKNKNVILVDDGLATGATMRAAIAAMQDKKAKHIIVAVSVGAEDICRHIEHEADELHTVIRPRTLHGVGQWYHHFGQLSDKEVRAYIELADVEQEKMVEEGLV